jgi:hypothetical protein
MKRHSASVLYMFCFLMALTFLSGCGIRYVETKHPEKFNSLRLMDPNRSPFEIIKSDTEPNKRTIKHHSGKIILEKPCRVNYRKFDFDYCRHVVVTGQLSNGAQYPVNIDSGCAEAEIIINDIVVKENNLETLFGSTDANLKNVSAAEKRTKGGLCFLSSLKIGAMTIETPFCVYLPWHLEFNMLGIPLCQDKQLFLGIPIMSQFKYLYFDNPNRQLEFSYSLSFQPDEPAKWTSYPFVLQKEKGGNGRIMVDMPIAGRTCDIYFDTGGGGTVIKSDMWGQIRNNITVTKSKNGRFLSHQIGWLPCCKVTAEVLSVGNIAIKNAEIVIMPEDTPYLPKGVPGYISIWTFKDTSVVLDFEHNLFWIKNQE